MNAVITREPREARYMILGVMSALSCVFGIAYTPLSNVPPRLPVGLDVLTGIVPLWVFGALWLTTGVGGIVTVALRRTGTAVFAAQFGMDLTWTGAYATAWLLGDDRAWISTAIFFAHAGVVAFATRVEPPLWRPPHWWLRWTR